MTLRTRAFLSVIAAFLAAAGFMIAAFSTSSNLYSILFGILAFAFLIPMNMWLRNRFKCPICGTSVFETGGLLVTFWPVRTCSKCGADLRNR